MGRIINPDNVGSLRNRVSKAVVLALNEYSEKSYPREEARDMLAFVILSLEAISNTIDQSVLAWEKRGYWVKADRFRLEWLWAKQLAGSLRKALLQDDWASAEKIVYQIRQKLIDVQVSPRHRMGKPWVGAWQKLR